MYIQIVIALNKFSHQHHNADKVAHQAKATKGWKTVNNLCYVLELSYVLEYI